VDHVFVVDVVETHQVIFRCLNCNRTNGVVKPEFGEPCAVDDGEGGWLPPSTMQEHWGPCEGAPE
jgi:hypothetical protein